MNTQPILSNIAAKHINFECAQFISIWDPKYQWKLLLTSPCICILNKNTLCVRKVRGQSEAALQTGATKNFDIS